MYLKYLVSLIHLNCRDYEDQQKTPFQVNLTPLLSRVKWGISKPGFRQHVRYVMRFHYRSLLSRRIEKVTLHNLCSEHQKSSFSISTSRRDLMGERLCLRPGFRAYVRCNLSFHQRLSLCRLINMGTLCDHSSVPTKSSLRVLSLKRPYLHQNEADCGQIFTA